jgi:hypothetical protein
MPMTSLGRVLFELLTGQPVFPDDARLLQRHLFESPPRLRQHRPDVAEELETLTLDLLEEFPEQRPPDAQAVFERLSPFLPTRGSLAPQDRGTPGGDPGDRRGLRRALAEFDRLADAFGRVMGPYIEDALECRRHAALCRAQLGQGTAALEELRRVLTHFKELKGDGDETVLDVRRDIGSLLVLQ